MSTAAANSERFLRARPVVWLSALLPLLLLGGILYLLFTRGLGWELAAPAPLERVEFERVVLKPGEIRAHIINTGPEAVTIQQVQVGWITRASWEFEVTPGPTIPRLGRAVVHIPYPWLPGEPYELVLITANNLLFTHEIAIAAETPSASGRMVGSFVLLGTYVGVIPVFLGILWLPFLRALPATAFNFLLSLTSGLLVFLGADALHDAFENSDKVPAPYQGVALIVIGLSLSVLALYAVSGSLKRRAKSATEAGFGLVLAYAVAFSIGVHNLGEGLAIGSAYTLGEVATGFLLVLGFTVHNLTEGIAIVAPVVRARFRLIHLLWLGLLAGGPTIAGTLLGAFSYTALWAVLFLAFGAGAVFQVVIEITRHQLRQAGAAGLLSGSSLAGFALGLAVMYVTGLFVTL
ncbi:MAG: ZIP family metal transporter [Terriglobia bacterium]